MYFVFVHISDIENGIEHAELYADFLVACADLSFLTLGRCD
jgi:hypothetical protein